MRLSEGMSEPKKSVLLQSTSKRVKMIFSVMASPNRIDILRILNSKGPLTYSDMKSMAGFRSKKESGKFAYHLRKLLRQSLVSLNKSERRYTITNLGKLVLSLARQIEERSIIESGKMYVRTSHASIEEFNSYKIVQSLIREGSLPLDLAQKIAEEVETKIYKYHTTYLTGALIREIVNTVLLEYGHEEYRNKLTRLGLPVYNVQEMLSNLDNADSGAEDLLLNAGQAIFAEHLLTNVLPKDVADFHLSGDLHISGSGVWSMIPDTVFVNVHGLVRDGLDLGGKYLDVSRFPSPGRLDEAAGALSVVIPVLAKEASQEVVLDGLVQLLEEYPEPAADLEGRLAMAFAAASTSLRYGRTGPLISIRLHLRPGADKTDAVGTVVRAYRDYVRMTPTPKIGLIINYEKGDVGAVSGLAAEIVSLGGRVMFARGDMSSRGIVNRPAAKSTVPLSIMLESVSINLPRLAFESNKDETYFRARLALLIKPALSSMTLRKKDISDLTRRGLNPILARNTQYMQKSSISLVVNLVGVREAVFNILGFQDNKEGREILHKVIGTAADVGAKKGKELGSSVVVCMTETESGSRFINLDAVKYGKNPILSLPDSTSYSQGILINASAISDYTPKSAPISECNRLAKMLNGGLSVTLKIDDEGMGADDIRLAIERASALLPSFLPVKRVTICGECGFKDEPFEDKCPSCKSPYVG